MPPTKKIDIVLDGTQAFTDEVLRFPGAGAVTLQTGSVGFGLLNYLQTFL